MNRLSDETQQTEPQIPASTPIGIAAPAGPDAVIWTDSPWTGYEAIQRVCDEFATAWRRGAMPRIEDFVGRLPAAMAAELLRQLLSLEVDLRRKAGQLPDESDYADRFAEQSDIVQLAFQTLSTQAEGGPRQDLLAGGNRVALADYELTREIARGGMGVVYEARQRSLKRTVALKMILAGQLASEEAVRRFYAEAQAAAGLNHPHIVPVYEVGQEAGQHFFSMGYVDGESLAARVAKRGPLPPREAARLVRQIAEAVEYAHGQGVVHRDLKPHNVLLTRSGIPMVTDFGLAKQLHDVEGLTVSGQLLGTPNFMAPEQAQGHPDQVGPLSDVHALGATLYHLLTGRPPFHTASIVETLKQVVEREPVSPRKLNPEVNRDLETICLKCLQKDPAQRYASAQRLADDLRRFLEHREILARPIGGLEKLGDGVAAALSTAALVAVSALVLVVGVPLAVWYQAQLTASQALAQAAHSDRVAAEQRAEASRLKAAAAQQEAEASQKAAAAAQQLAATQEYFATVNGARQTISRARPGWTRRALAKLQHAAALDTPDRNIVELRSEAVRCLTSYDVQPPAVLADGMQAGQVTFSADGAWLAVGQFKAQLFAFCTVLVLDVETGEPVHKLPYGGALIMNHGKPVQDGCRQLAFSPDRRWLACGARSGYVHVWDLQQLPPQLHSWQAHGQEILSLLFTDNTHLCTSGETEKTVKLWSLEGEIGADVIQHEAHNEIYEVSLHPREGHLLVGSRDGHTARLNADTLESVESLHSPLRGSAWSSALGGAHLVGGQGRMELLWGLNPGNIARTYDDRTNSGRNLFGIKGVSFAHDGRLMLTAHRADRLATLWESTSGAVVANLPFEPEAIIAAALDPLGRRVAAVAYRQVLLYPIDTNLCQSLVTSYLWPVTSMAWGPPLSGQGEISSWLRQLNHLDASLMMTLGKSNVVAAHPGTKRAASFYDDSQTEVWDLNCTPGKTLVRFNLPKVSRLCFSPNGRRLWGISDDLRVWSWSEGENEHKMQFDNQVQDLLTGRSGLQALAAGDTFVLVGTRLGELLMLDDRADKSPASPKSWRLSEAPIQSLALAPDQSLAACGTASGEVLLAIVPGGEVKKLAPHDDDVTSVAFSPDGNYLASASLDRTVRLWRCRGQAVEELLTWRLPVSVLEVSFHPNGRTLAVRAQGELAIRLLDLNALETQLADLSLGWSKPTPAALSAE